jgi:predicted O-linked N-acetylglucosamine transferase (SPINDLY family)
VAAMRGGPDSRRTFEKAIALHRQNEHTKAEKLYRRVLAEDSGHPGASHLLSALLLEQGRNEEAARLLRRALSDRPGEAVLHANLGEALRRLGEIASATTSLRRAIALQPALAEAHYTLGLVMSSIQHPEDAIEAYRRAVLLKPGLLAAHRMLAVTLRDLERVDEAGMAWARALELDSTCAEGHDGLGAVLLQQGRIDDAIESFRKAIACDATHRAAHSHLVYALGLDPRADAPSILAEAIRWSERHTAHLASERLTHGNDRSPGRRLRVGYLSPDFRNHSHSLFLLPLFEHHDRTAVEVFAYSLVRHPDEFTERTRTLVDHFREVSAASDAELVAAIRGDGIDVLFDVTMHLAENRLCALARKPAPIQIAWLAYPGTTGLDAIDYRITDVFLDPPHADTARAYSERSLSLPETFWCYDPFDRQTAVAALPALDNGHVTFGCLNNFNRTNDEVFALWSRVLREVDGSRMVVFAWPGESRQRALDAFARGGIAAERLDFVGFRPRSEYFHVYDRIDVCLDTVPHNAGTTSLDAFWMGVPVVTLVGHTAVGRMGLSFASNLELPALVARTPEEYVELSRRLVGDLPRLAVLRAELRARMQRSPLMNPARFARNLESAIRSAWMKWCQQDSVAVPE